jgi:hypothetical protein
VRHTGVFLCHQKILFDNEETAPWTDHDGLDQSPGPRRAEQQQKDSSVAVLPGDRWSEGGTTMIDEQRLHCSNREVIDDQVMVESLRRDIETFILCEAVSHVVLVIHVESSQCLVRA